MRIKEKKTALRSLPIRDLLSDQRTQESAFAASGKTRDPEVAASCLIWEDNLASVVLRTEHEIVARKAPGVLSAGAHRPHHDVDPPTPILSDCVSPTVSLR